MAKMYSRDKGKSGSTRPVERKAPGWLRYQPKEVEMLVVKKSKEGLMSSEIGLHLRDSYGIPDVKAATGKKINQILTEKKLAKELPEDLLNLIKRSVDLRTHMEENTKDMTAKRGLQLTESKIRRLIPYYLKNDRLPVGWKYDPKKAKLLLE
jgi:small subunit ribosomal protein S15